MTLPMWFRSAALILACSQASVAHAERHAIYIDVLGKGGLWGLGYDYQLTTHFAIGTVASYYHLTGDHYATWAPYLAACPIGRGRHRWFAQAGPQIVHHVTPSPVAEWQGMTTTGASGELSSGY